MDFHIGERVRLVVDYPDGNHSLVKGDTGEIILIDNDPPTSVGVRWDNGGSGFHSLGGKCEYNHGWWVLPEYIEKISEFCVGDTVRCVKASPSHNRNIKTGMIGTIRAIEEEMLAKNRDYNSIGVEWSENIHGNTLGDKCEHGFGWWVCPDEIELVGRIGEYCEEELAAPDITDNDFLALFGGA